MSSKGDPVVESESMSDFARIMRPESALEEGPSGPRPRINIDPENVKRGLGQLVLVVVKLLHEVLERQAIRRMDAGSLTDEETERLGLALSRQSEEIENLRKVFDLEEDDLNLDLGPLGKLC